MPNAGARQAHVRFGVGSVEAPRRLQNAVAERKARQCHFGPGPVLAPRGAACGLRRQAECRNVVDRRNAREGVNTIVTLGKASFVGLRVAVRARVSSGRRAGWPLRGLMKGRQWRLHVRTIDTRLENRASACKTLDARAVPLK